MIFYPVIHRGEWKYSFRYLSKHRRPVKYTKVKFFLDGKIITRKRTDKNGNIFIKSEKISKGVHTFFIKRAKP